MSADNGIYILVTNVEGTVEGHTNVIIGNEYRVRELFAIDNLEYDEDVPMPIPPDPSSYWDNKFHSHYEYMPDHAEHMKYREAYNNRYNSSKSEVRIRNARVMWNRCKVYNNLEEAYVEADRLLEATMICEYGISKIQIDEVF